MGGDNGGASNNPPTPPGVRAIQEELARRPWRSLAQAEAFLPRRMAEHNATPQPELCGLSPLQAHELLSGDWESTGPLRLNQDLSLEELGGCHFLLAARALLPLAGRGHPHASYGTNRAESFPIVSATTGSGNVPASSAPRALQSSDFT